MWRWNRVSCRLLLGWLWICALGVSLLVSAQNAYHWSMQVEEYAYGCDAFGYLQMGRAVRRAAAKQELPEFHLESPQTRLLIERMQAEKLPLVSWDEVVAPHAHHYFPNSDHVGVQYPPGTALALAFFPEGQAVHGLSQTAIGLLLGIAAVALVLAGIKQAWAAGGFVALTIHLGLEMLARIWNMSFSINAVLIPLTLSCLCVFAALGLRAQATSGRAVWLLALLSGCLFGLAILIRLPVVLLVPGFLVLLWSSPWRPGVPAIAFGLAAMLVGIIPFLVHQHRLTGAWYLPTYARHDTSPPSFEWLQANLSYYLGDGPGSEDNWAPGILVIGVLGLIVRRGRSNPAPPGLGWTWLIVAALLVWTIPTAYFLPHRVVTPYYPMAATLGAVAILSFGALTIERLAPARHLRHGSLRRAALSWIAGVLALLPGVVSLGRTVIFYSPSLDSPEAPPRQLSLPAELADDRAWIWADMLTGTLWYHAEKPAFKIRFGDDRARVAAYRLAFERGEPQYLIRDLSTMQETMDEITHLGGTLILRGEIEGCPYYLIGWNKNGPKCRPPTEE